MRSPSLVHPGSRVPLNSQSATTSALQALQRESRTSAVDTIHVYSFSSPPILFSGDAFSGRSTLILVLSRVLNIWRASTDLRTRDEPHRGFVNIAISEERCAKFGCIYVTERGISVV